MLQQLNSLANIYEQLAIHKNSQNGGNGGAKSSNTKGQFFANPLFEGNGGIQVKTLRLDFPKFDGSEPLDWILKVEHFFDYFHTLDDQKLDIAFFHREGKALSWFGWLKD